jgi:hypothetical protein
MISIENFTPLGIISTVVSWHGITVPKLTFTLNSKKTLARHNGFKEIKIGYGNYLKKQLSFGLEIGYRATNGKYVVEKN